MATLVAEAAAPSAVFASVAEEVCRLLIAERAYVGRFEEDDTVTVIAGWNATGEEAPGFPVKLSGDEGLSARVRETGRPGRVDRYDEPVRQQMLDRGIRSAVAAPITVERRIWGTVAATSASDDPAPPSAEERLSRFSELVGTAIANAQAREELRRAADDQAALRRVATLVAREAPPAEVFAAVAAEVGRLLSMEGAGVLRYDGDRCATVVGGWSGTADPARIGLTIPLGGHNAVTRVFETGRPARIEYAADDSNAATAHGREAGGQAAIGAPIGVAGRLWGAVVLVTGGEDTLTAETETRLVAFTELVATAIANAEARGELRRVADEQAALRRVATLVARGAPPAEVFAAVAEEVGRLLRADNALVVGFDDDDATATVVALSGAPQVAHVGLRQRFSESRMSRLVHESGQAVRIDDYAALTGGGRGRHGSLRRRRADHGGRSAVGHDRGLLAPSGFPRALTPRRV